MKISYLNYRDLNTSLLRYDTDQVQPFLDLLNSQKVYNYYCIKDIITIVSDFVCRSNLSKNPFQRSLEDYQRMPVYNDKFNKSISDICDERALELEKKVLENNKKLMVQWSGGIDSTAVLVSILKNFSKEALEQVEVACSHISIMENNTFFLNHIHNKVKIVHNNWKFKSDSDFYFVDGEPGDFLFGSEFCINQFMSRYPTKTYEKWSSNMSILRQLFKHKENMSFSNWFLNEQIENFNNVNVPVETVMDFFWWINFDNRWSVKSYGKIISYLDYSDMNKDSINLIMNNGINFFNTLDFQQWSMSKNNTEEKIIKSIIDYKMPLKKYIYEFDNNEFYLNFKTKVNSNSLYPKYSLEKPILILDNGISFNTFNIMYSLPYLQKLKS
jgi:hypothetical protein